MVRAVYLIMFLQSIIQWKFSKRYILFNEMLLNLSPPIEDRLWQNYDFAQMVLIGNANLRKYVLLLRKQLIIHVSWRDMYKLWPDWFVKIKIRYKRIFINIPLEKCFSDRCPSPIDRNAFL